MLLAHRITVANDNVINKNSQVELQTTARNANIRDHS